MTVSTALAANQRLDVTELGDFFRLMEADLTVTVEFYFNGRKIKEAKNVRSGFAEAMNSGVQFEKLTIVNGATPQNIQYVVRLGSRVEYDVPPVGNVAITNTGGAFTQGAVAVVNTGTGVVVSAANPLRRAGLFINTDPSAMIYLTVNGSAPTPANGIPLEPGDSWQSPGGYCPTGAIRAKSDTATATAVWVEG